MAAAEEAGSRARAPGSPPAAATGGADAPPAPRAGAAAPQGLAAAPLLPLATAFAAGILAGASAWAPATWVSCAAAGALLGAAGLALVAGWARAATALLLVAVAALGALRAAGSPLAADHVARLALPARVALEGRLAAEPVRWAPGRARVLLEVSGHERHGEWRPASGLVSLTFYSDGLAVGTGQPIRVVDARLHRPTGFRNPGGFDYPAHLRRQGVLVVGTARAEDVTPRGPDRPGWPAVVRRWAIHTIRSRLPETSGALLAGLLLGERTTLPRETDEAFRAAGVYHVLAVSGANVALVAVTAFGALTLLGVPRRATLLGTGAALVGFALVVGGEPSVLRATAMGLLLLGAGLVERDSALMNAVALAGLGLLAFRPADLWDPGFQLSFAATAGIAHLAPPLFDWLGRLEAWPGRPGIPVSERGAPRWLAAGLAVSVAAQAAVAPLMLLHFNQLSLIGVAANLAVVPLAGLATTLGMLALGLQALHDWLATPVWSVLWAGLVLQRAAAWAAAQAPMALVHLPAPPLLAALAWYGALALAPRVAASRPARWLAPGLLVLALALSSWPWVRPGDGRLRVVFLDVGQGDAALVELPDGPRLLVDAGSGGPGRLDVGARVLSPYLWNRAIRRLDAVAATHPDLDHAGGLAAVLRHFRVGEVWDAAGADALGTVATRSTLAGVPRRVLATGDRVRLGEALVTVLGPDGAAAASRNEASLVLRLDWRGVSVLLTGDLGAEGERRLLAGGAPLRALVLKVGHHGSRFASSGEFLRAVSPRVAVVSVGGRNPFGHPSPAALERLGAAGARVYRTDRDGAVIVEADGSTLRVTRWATGEIDVLPLPEDGATEAR